MQYFNILQSQTLKIDKIERFLGCICLRWHRKFGKDGIILGEKELGLISVGAIRGTVHLVQRNKMIPRIESQNSHAVSHFKVCNGTEGWGNQLLYVNLFLDGCIDEVEYDELDGFCAD